MGGSSSSLLDESKCAYIRGRTEAVINNFSPHYKRQYAVAFCKHIQNELEQSRDLQSQFLKTKPPAESSTTFYEGESSHFAEDLKKWKDRYIVINSNYSLESFDSKEAFQKGLSSKTCILPVGGKVLITDEGYNSLSDKHFPDPNGSNEKENAQAFVVFPKEFPVYLWQPFLRDNYFCFSSPEAQKQFSTALNDCIRHLNHDFFKQTSFEAQAFLEAVQFFRQEKGHYGSWEMITGNEIQILSNLVMEELLPSLQSTLLPKMKGKRNDRKRVWFGILEETYHLVQEQVSEGLRSLKEEGKEIAKTLEGTVRSNMDQIVTSKNFLAGKIKESISEPVQICCGESIQPFLASVLEELMGPVSSGFNEVRQLFEKEVNSISQNFQATTDIEKLKEDVNSLTRLPYNSVKMEPCYLKVNLLRELLQDLKSRFKFYNIDLIIQRTQNVMQELMENAVYTFEQLLDPGHHRDKTKMATVIEKVKLRVLKQYDYDSSTVRKKIFQDALVQISLPTLQRTLAPACKPELQKYEQFIFAEHTSVIQVENVYEEILLQALLDEILKVIKEAAHLKKHNLFEEVNHPYESVSSLSDLKTPSGSAQASPARKPTINTTEMLDADTQSNEVFTPEKITQALVNKEEISDTVACVATEPREEGMISDKNGSCKSPSVMHSAEVEKIAPQPSNVVETSDYENVGTENKVPVQEVKFPGPDGVNEIRDLLTLTVELPADVPFESKQQIVHDCGVLKSQECTEEKDKEEEISTEGQITHEKQEPPSIDTGDEKVTNICFSPSVEAEEVSVTVGRSSLSHVDPSEGAEELDLPQTSQAELEAETTVWYTDVKSGSPDFQLQTKPLLESGHMESNLSPLPLPSLEKESQDAENGKLDQGREGSPFNLVMDGNSQMVQYVEEVSSAVQQAELFPTPSALMEVDVSASGLCAHIQESSVNIENVTEEPPDLSVSPEVKESSVISQEVSANSDSNILTFLQTDDFKETRVTPIAHAASTTESETDEHKNAERSYSEPQLEE
uniref:Niban apoptosis regulator 1 n=1 Tax=Salvator merianae TaxID=96440 RepID=A0A8D0DQM9_SALMN